MKAGTANIDPPAPTYPKIAPIAIPVRIARTISMGRGYLGE
jgi:hypothetical protein